MLHFSHEAVFNYAAVLSGIMFYYKAIRFQKTPINSERFSCALEVDAVKLAAAAAAALPS